MTFKVNRKIHKFEISRYISDFTLICASRTFLVLSNYMLWSFLVIKLAAPLSMLIVTASFPTKNIKHLDKVHNGRIINHIYQIIKRGFDCMQEF